MNLALLGPRGCGKTTVGRLIAESCGWAFVDLDEVVQSRFPESTVGEIWAVHGQAAWRATEATALRETLKSDRQIVALGGGVPMIDAARALLNDERERGRLLTAYLACSVGELARRLEGQTGDRPSLTGADPIDEIAIVLAQREGTYREVADRMIDVTNSTSQDVATSLQQWLKSPPQD